MSMNNNFLCLGLVIEAIKEHKLGEYDSNGKYKKNGDRFNIYWKPSKSSPNLEDIIYVGQPNKIEKELSCDDIDCALIPDPARDRNWELLYNGQLVEDIIISATSQLPKIDSYSILRAIEYYMQYDCFYDFINIDENVGKL